jgi:hypothetical protein
MKPLVKLLLITFICSVSCASDIELCGFLSATHGPLLFALTDPASRTVSPWIKIGQEWQACTLSAYDSSSGELTTRLGAGSKVLKLRGRRMPTLTSPTSPNVEEMLTDGTTIYAPDAVLTIGDMKITSPNGVMVSDKLLQIISGDFTVQTPRSTINIHQGFLRFADGRLMMKGAVITFPPRSAEYSPAKE